MPCCAPDNGVFKYCYINRANCFGTALFSRMFWIRKGQGWPEENESRLGEELILPSFFFQNNSSSPRHVYSYSKYLLEARSVVFADAGDTTVDKTSKGSMLLELRFKKQMEWTILGKYEVSKINSRRNRKQCNVVGPIVIPTLMKQKGKASCVHAFSK